MARTFTTAEEYKDKAKKALDKVNKEFGIKSSTTSKSNTTTKKDDKGKQNTSASSKNTSTKSNTTSTNNKAKEALDLVNKEFGIKGTAVDKVINSPKGTDSSNWKNRMQELSGSKGNLGVEALYPKTALSQPSVAETSIVGKKYSPTTQFVKHSAEYWEARYYEEMDRLEKEHANDPAFPVAAHAVAIVDKEKKREDAEYKQFKKIEELNAHTKAVTSKKDYVQNSKYSPSKPLTDEELKAAGYKQAKDGNWYRQANIFSPVEWYTGADSDVYTYINDASKRTAIGNSNSSKTSSVSPDGTVTVGTDIYKTLGYHTLTDEQKGAFNYLYNQDRKNGTNTAEEYLSNISPLLQQQAAEQEAKTYKEMAKESPVAMSVISVGTNLQNAAMFPVKAAATAMGVYDDVPLLDMYGNRTQAIRGGATEDMGTLGKLGYNAVMSISDMGAAMLVGGGNAKAIQAIMSSSAASSTISEAKNNGASDGKAIVLGLGSAAIEWATEKYSVEAILKEPKTLLGFVGVNTFTEATEEGASNVANMALDYLVSVLFGERTEIERMVDYLVLYEGKTEEEALQIVAKEKWKSLGEDMLVGGLSGFGMSGSKASVIGANNAIKTRAITNPYMKDGESLDALIEEGKYYGEGSEPFNLAAEVELAKENGGVKRGQIMALINANDNAKALLAPDTLEQAAMDVVANRNATQATENEPVSRVSAVEDNLSTQDANSFKTRKMDSVLGNTERTIGVAGGQAYVTNSKDILPSPSNRSVFLATDNAEVAKAELGATESGKASENISKILASDFTPVREDFVDGTLENVGEVRVFTDENGREIALEKNVAEYFEGYNMEATFRGGKPYAIKATDNDGNVAGVAMAVWQNSSGQSYDISYDKAVTKPNTPYNVMSNENPILQDRQAREAYIKKATGYGKYGVQAFADIMETVSESEAPVVAKAFRTAYEAGLTNLETAQATLPTEVHQMAFTAGKQDYIMENVGKKANVKNVKSHGDKAGFDSTNVPSNVSKQALDIVNRFYRELGVKGMMVGDSDMYNANLTPNVGVVQMANNFTVLKGLQEKFGNDATSLSFVTHALHEAAGHRAEELAPVEYAEFKREMYNYRKSLVGFGEADDKRRHYGNKGVDITLSEAMDEVVSDSIFAIYDNDINLLAEGLDRVLNGNNAKAKKGANIFKQALDYVIDKFNKLLNKLGVETRQSYDASLNEITKIRDLFEKALGAAIAKNKEIAKTSNLVTEKNGTIVDANGNVVAQINEDGTATFSLKTFDDSGRAELKKWLDRNVKNKKLTETEANDISEQLEYYYDICKQYEDKYAPFSAWSKAEVVKGLDGKPLMSVVKANGDYSMNLDFSLVCKKRRPLDALYRAMIDDGFMDDIGQLSEIEVARINEIIRNNGFETACTLCFVDSKRYRQYAVADAFVSKYNELVKMLAPEGVKIDRFDFSGKRQPSADGLHTMSNADLKSGINKLNKVIKEHGESTVVGKIANHLKAVPQDRKLVMVSDFMDSEGFVRVKKSNPEVLKLYNSSKGSGGPKASLPDVQYLGEILKGRGFTAKKAYSVGGVRVQSFSDYIPRLVFDYLQMTADLSAKKLPAHAYSKEDIFVMQFGKTGIKINMSLVPAVAKDGIAAGLDKDGNYVWVDGHTFASDFHKKGSGQKGFELAVKIQNTEGYSQNCGTVAVGVSDEHIVKMLKDDNIRMVIPYHLSGLNHFVAQMGNIDQYKNYTDVQNTRVKATGKKIEGKDFSFNEAFHRLGDAKAATKEYLAWCEKNDYIPKFDAFAFHEDAEVRENYYKVLIDFAAYDSEGNATPQGAVTMNFPTENDAFGSMKDLIAKGLEADAILEGRKASDIPKILKEVKATLGANTEGKKFSLKDTNLTQSDVDAVRAISNKKGEISVNNFTSDDIKATENWAKKFYSELGNKSPFFRAWFGDWRANDKTKVSVVYANKKTGKNPRGVFANKDTGWNINSSSVGYDETVSHSGKDKLSLIAMRSIDEIIENSILLDTEVSSYGRGKKSIYTAFMHKFYSYVVIDGKPCIAKMTVDESYAPKQSDTNKKFYHVRAIKIEPVTSVGIGFNHIPIMDGTGSNITVSELFNFVKTFDEKFNPKKVSGVVNDDGTPAVMYHGTTEIFTTFERGDIGYHFGTKDQAEYRANFVAYMRDVEQQKVMPCYLNIKNPYVFEYDQGRWEGDFVAKRMLATGEFANDSVATAELEEIAKLYDISKESTQKSNEMLRKFFEKRGYDGIKYLNEIESRGDTLEYSYIAFRKNQIKSATENIGTFDNGNNDINYSLKGTEGIPLKELPKVRKAVADKRADVLAKYVDSGAMSTELYNQLIEEFGAIPVGENPSRDVIVPKKTAKDKNVSQTVRTILEAGATPDEVVPTIEKMVEDGIFSYDVYTDKAAIADGENYIKTHGWEESLLDWFEAVNSGEVSKEITTTGWILYNHAANSGDAKTAIKILDAMVRHQRSAAQAVQATRILKKLSPSAQLYGVQKSVEAFKKELVQKYGDKAPDLEINQELAEQFINAQTEEERLAIEIELYKDIGRQMPSNWLDKWNAWRYIAMLTNPRTHIRNIAGNAIFAPVVITKDLTATVIESLVAPAVRLSGKKMVRGKSFIWGNKADRALLKAAWNDYKNVADIVSGDGKYNDSAMGNKHIQEGRRIFKGILAPVEWVRRGNSKLLEWEDMWFSKPHYAYALAQYCKANNISPEQISRGKAIAPAREYAIKEAQKATYRDTNAFSQMVSEIGRHGGRNWATNAKRTLAEGVLPFRKTPANILVRGVEYSPLGFIKGIATLAKVGKEVDGRVITASEAIDNFAAGLTGTGLLALGWYLAAQGLIRGHGGEDKDEKEFKELMGHQDYALELSNGESITLDWLAPESLPFFTGVAIWEMSTGNKEDLTLADLQTALSGISDPMLEMSFLQGLNDALESIGYAQSNEMKAVPTLISTILTSYISQGIPTLFGQIERTGEEERMTTYTEKDGNLTKDTQYALGKASAKIPFWDYNQIPYIDAWGRKEASGTALKRGLNNFLNPAYTSTIETSDMEKELLRLFEKTGEGGVFPSRADKKFTVDGEDKHLTAEEYVRYATLKGEKSYKAVSDLVKSNAYKKLSDEEKVKAIEKAYDYANQKAKEAISKYEPQSWVGKADEFGSNVGNYLAFKTEVESTKDAKGDDFSKQDVIDIILDTAQNDSETWKMYLSEYDAKKDIAIHDAGVGGEEYMTVIQNVDKCDEPNKNGNLGTYTNAEIAAAIRMTDGLTNSEKAVLWQQMTGSTSTKNNPWRSYLP